MLKTPTKSYLNECLKCGSDKVQLRKVGTVGHKERVLFELLKKYGGVAIERGFLCKNCYRILEHLDQKCKQFYNECQRGCSNGKRMATSPGASTPKRKKNFPKTAINRQLFGALSKQNQLITDIEDGKGKENIKQIADTTSRKNVAVLKENTALSNGADDHIYAKQRDGTKQPKHKPTQPSDHDYATSVTSQVIESNPILNKITEFTREHGFLDSKQLPANDIESLCAVIRTENVKEISTEILKVKDLRCSIIQQHMSEIEEASCKLKNRKLFLVSELMKKSPQDLKTFDWIKIVDELMTHFPTLFILVLSMVLSPHDMQNESKIDKLIPRIGLVYAILMQAKNHELSRVQRIMSLLLIDNICDQKVFDRLQPVGVSLSYNQSLKIVDIAGGHFNDQVIELITSDTRFRIVGDNINWMVRVHDHRLDNKNKMMHAFGSAIIVQNVDFSHTSMQAPQKSFMDMSVQEFLPSATDIKNTKNDYVILTARVSFKHIPYFQRFEDVVPKNISNPCSEKLKVKSKVIPLPVLFENEQYYQDVVKIMEFYEDCLIDAHTAAGKEITGKKFHIGGDQLTRERFSGAKSIRAHHPLAHDKFEHLSTITFELFHMHMNYLKMIFKTLYDNDSVQDIGTLKSLQERISRINVGQNVNEHYDADKDFAVSVTDAYIVECMLEYFGMENIHSEPTKNRPPDFISKEEKKDWFFEVVGKMIDHSIFKTATKKLNQEVLEVDGHTMTLTLANGKTITLVKPSLEKQSEDCVENYAHRVLEVGLLFKDLLDLAHQPERNRGLRLLKHSMVYFKSFKNLSKYALEILRLLVHQMCILSEKEANEEFYGLFVNTSGQYDSHIPTDQRMEYLVKEVKEHIKHMYSNKTETNIANRTRAISGIREIAQNFDKQSSVLVRSKKHSDKQSQGDEVVIIDALRCVRPFQHIPGRSFASFPHMKASIVENLDISHFHEWIETRKVKFALEKGN